MPDQTSTTNNPVKIGDIVIVKLSEDMVAQVMRERNDWSRGSLLRGTPVDVGVTVPMVVTAVQGSDCCSGQILLDGNQTLWATSLLRGDDAGLWQAKA